MVWARGRHWWNVLRGRNRGAPGDAPAMSDDAEERFAAERRDMVRHQLRARGIRDEHVLRAFEAVPRHRFVPPGMVGEAYRDYPLGIGEGQTISQPYMIAVMLEAMRLHGGERVLEVGTGSGYQTALLCELGCAVYTIERIALLQERARRVLEKLGYTRVHYRVGDGSLGWPEEAPFDRITVGAAAPRVPPSLVEQIAEGGNLILPVGGAYHQDLVRVEKRGGHVHEENLGGCVFVKLIGAEGF